MTFTQIRTTDESTLKIAIVGAGAAGLTAAYLLQQKHDVTIFEQQERLGGHAHTLVVDRGVDAGTAIDIGFMVLNDINYPTMHKLLNSLGDIKIGSSDMSFSYHTKDGKFQYAYANPRSRVSTKPCNASTSLLRQTSNPKVARIVKEIFKFGRRASQDLLTHELDDVSLGQYLEHRQFSAELVDFYIVPTTAAIWSTPPGKILSEFPARTFLHFMNNHGMLNRDNVPQWQYIKGGSRSYIEAIRGSFNGNIETNSSVISISRSHNTISIETESAIQNFDRVVIGTHADQALKLLADPSNEERNLLGVWEYQTNHTVVHTNDSVMPPDRQVWAAWNYKQEASKKNLEAYSVTYYLNRLQRHYNTENQYFVTLNTAQVIPEENILYRVPFSHPIYTSKSIRTQKLLAQLSGTNNTFFCGSYLGYGFHEDAIKSGVAVAEKFGITL